MTKYTSDAHFLLHSMQLKACQGVLFPTFTGVEVLLLLLSSKERHNLCT
jgi:hypothetical protein